MGVVDAGKGGIRTRRAHGAVERTKPTSLGIDNLVENLAAILRHAGARTTRTVVPDRKVRLAVDQQEMTRAFAALPARGATVTILGGLLPIVADEGGEDKGCAFLSMSVRAEPSAGFGPSRDALVALGGIIKKHGGSFRLWSQSGETWFSLYLPVLRGA
jgi:hypothetical protein